MKRKKNANDTEVEIGHNFINVKRDPRFFLSFKRVGRLFMVFSLGNWGLFCSHPAVPWTVVSVITIVIATTTGTVTDVRPHLIASATVTHVTVVRCLYSGFRFIYSLLFSAFLRWAFSIQCTLFGLYKNRIQIQIQLSCIFLRQNGDESRFLKWNEKSVLNGDCNEITLNFSVALQISRERENSMRINL